MNVKVDIICPYCGSTDRKAVDMKTTYPETLVVECGECKREMVLDVFIIPKAVARRIEGEE